MSENLAMKQPKKLLDFLSEYYGDRLYKQYRQSNGFVDYIRELNEVFNRMEQKYPVKSGTTSSLKLNLGRK